MAEPFKCVSLDPPWLERGGGKVKRGADRHYPLMSKEEIFAKLNIAFDWFPSPLFNTGPIDFKPINDDAHCWLWVTDNFLRDGLWLMDKLGFRYVRTMVWVKMRQIDGWSEDDFTHHIAGESLQIGLGQYLRGAHELCLFGTRGDAQVPKPADRLPSVVFAERGRHSAKPVEAYDVIERVSPGPRLELFARDPRDGWSVWGNEV